MTLRVLMLDVRALGLRAAFVGVLAAAVAGCAQERAAVPDASSRAGADGIRAAIEAMTERGWSEGDVAAFDATVADSVDFHYAGSPPRRVSRAALADVVLDWRRAFPDLRMEVEDVVVEGDLAAVRARLEGTHEGVWRGAEPTGERVGMALMMFMRFEDGRMVELWESDDQLGFRRQLGLI